MLGVLLKVHHPQVAMIPCSECQKWIYDFSTGRRKTVRCGPERKEEPIEQGPDPPCKQGLSFKCPKGSPEEEADHILTPANQRILDLYRRGKLTNFAGMELDMLTLELLAVVDLIYSEYQIRATADASNSALDRLGPLLNR